MEKQEMTVTYDSGRLSVLIPGLGVRRLEGPDAQGVWSYSSGDYQFSFIRDEAGEVRTMILTESVRNVRIGGEGR
jgi:hypothetical protein